MKEELMAVRKLIEKPENWTQGAYARTKTGSPIRMTSDEAVCFCLSGALGRINAGIAVRQLVDAEAAKFSKTDFAPIPEFNDTHSHAEVLALLDRLIAQ